MQKLRLSTLFSEKLLNIPDYQRGYAWEQKQWNDLIEDLDALGDQETESHYAGTIVTYTPTGEQRRQVFYGNSKLDVADLVDGQQRLTTILIYLSVLIKKLEGSNLDYSKERNDYLFESNQTRLTLANDCQTIFFDLLIGGQLSTPAKTKHQKRLVDAYTTFESHLNTLLKDKGTDHLRELFASITSKLVFTAYPIEQECDIGMTFELMNSRGKELSTLELLKNYFMHWVSRNLGDTRDKGAGITDQINGRWKTTYTNVGDCDGNEDQALRIAWILMCSPTPKHWQGYHGFKDDNYFPIRGFNKNGIAKKDEIQSRLTKFSDLLAQSSKHYLYILSPTEDRCFSKNEVHWLKKIRRTGNTANFLPLMVSARIATEAKPELKDDYIQLLEALERYAYRVFIFEGKRSNAGRSSLFSKAYSLYKGDTTISTLTKEVDGLTEYYAPEATFKEEAQKPFNWYHHYRLLRYTLFEYELKLLQEKGHDRSPAISWEDLSDSTVEHIFPQKPKEQSQWLVDWNEEDSELWRHDIGNLSLTLDNSSYGRKEFILKKGSPGQGKCYADSTLFQERELARFNEWTPKNAEQRHNDLTDWIKDRWGLSQDVQASVDTKEADDEDGADT